MGKCWEKLTEVKIRKGASLQEMSSVLKEDLTFQDAFQFIDNVDDWLSEMLKTGFATVEKGDHLIIWVEYF